MAPGSGDGGFKMDYVGHGSVNHDPPNLVELLRLVIDDQELRLVRNGFDPLDNLLVVLVGNVGSIHFNNLIPSFHPCCFCWRVLVNFTNVLTRLRLLSMKVEAIAVEIRPLKTRRNSLLLAS